MYPTTHKTRLDQHWIISCSMVLKEGRQTIWINIKSKKVKPIVTSSLSSSVSESVTLKFFNIRNKRHLVWIYFYRLQILFMYRNFSFIPFRFFISMYFRRENLISDMSYKCRYKIIKWADEIVDSSENERARNGIPNA